MRNMVPPSVRRLASRDVRRAQSSGAALIVDAAASTALSARLQPFGTEGAEALADVLTAVFTPIVKRVAAEDGSVAEFAGDGIVAVFVGESGDAVGRAVRAARGIMADLDETVDIPTPVGPSHLTVRSVIGAGSIEWLVWTSGRKDAPQNAAYTVRGSAIAEAQRGEAATPGGVLSVGPDARRVLPEGTGTSPLTGDFVAVDVGSPPPTGAGGSDEDAPPPTGRLRFYPAAVTEAAQRGEFRDVVAVFVEFRRLPDPHNDRSAMARLLEHLADRRGYLCNVVLPSPDSDGIRVLALWGAPISHEHDIGHALRFVADVQAAAGKEEVRAGVTRSTVFAGFVGTRRQESYTGIGSGVNLAARMCAAAEWGEMRIDGHVARRLDRPWIVETLGGVEYRGFRAPIETHRVTYVPPVRRTEPSHDGVFVGRQEELDALEDLLAPVWRGHPAGIVAVTGEAGSGKSRLIATLRDRLSSRRPQPIWLEAQADEIGTQPLATLRDALAAYFQLPDRRSSADRLAAYIGRLQQNAPDLASELDRSRRTLGDLLGLRADVDAAGQLDPQTRFDNTVLAVADLLLAIERSNPVIISIADGHWIDGGSAGVVERVMRDLGAARIAVIVETRNPDSGLRPSRRVDVGPLDEPEIRRLATYVLGEKPSSGLVSLLSERSGGNAFFLLQLIEYLQRASLLKAGEDGLLAVEPDATVPDDVRHILVAKLDDLAGAVRRTVQTASVLGREVDLRVLERMTHGATDVDLDVAEGIEAHIWDRLDGERIAFRNLLVKDAAYGMLLHSELRMLHEEAAHAIESIRGMDEEAAAELAYHYERAGKAEVAAQHHLVAGRVAAGRYASDEALTHLHRVLDLLRPSEPERRLEALRLVYGTHDMLGDRAAQEETLRTMSAIAGDSAESAIEITLLRARLLTSLGSYHDAEQIAAEASAVAERHDLRPSLGSLLFLRAQLARYVGRTDAAQAHAAEARRIFVETGDPLQVASVDDFSGGMAWDRGDFVAAAELHRSAADVFHEAGRATDEIRALNNLGSAIFAMGDYATAREIHEAGAARSREIGYRMGEGDHLDNVGGTAWAVGDFDLAIERYSAALVIRERMNDAWGVAISKGNLGATYRALGQPGEALALHREALEIDRGISRRRGEAYDLHGIGMCHLDMGRHNLAAEALSEAAAIRAELGERHLAHESQIACAVAMLRRGDEHEARELVGEVLDAEGPSLFEGAVETMATLLRCIEVLAGGDPDRANELRRIAAAKVAERASRISDPAQRASYLEAVRSHREAAAAAEAEPPETR